jgi:CRP-like cAMP-binding protein
LLKNGMILDLLTTGECFGEMAVIGKKDSRRGADIVALTADAKLVDHRSALQRSSATCRMHFYQAFLAVLSERLTSANVRLVSASEGRATAGLPLATRHAGPSAQWPQNGATPLKPIRACRW